MAHTFDEHMDTAAENYILTLASKCVHTDADDTWYCIAVRSPTDVLAFWLMLKSGQACAFAAANQGKYVAHIYKAAITQYGSEDFPSHRCVLRRIKEALLKTGIIYGIPRVINAFRALIKALPNEESNETDSCRLHIERPADTDERGIEYMRNIFRADLEPFLDTMAKYWPDLRTLVVTTIYGYYQSDTSVIDAITTSQLNIATLVPMDVTAEVAWHMRGLIRNGGSEEQLRFAMEVTLAICEIADVRLKNQMPDPKVVIHEERLF
jgi:alkylhydroperoxidase/carboxymuconolactone decarboxylase family protein YurZ